MRAARALLALVGVAFGLWGVWLMRDFSGEQLLSVGIWLGGSVLLHDAVLAPLTVGLGVAGARLVPRHARAVAGVAFLLWATLTVTFLPVLSGQGGKPDNDTILGRPYLASWLVLTGILVGAAVIAARRRRTLRPAEVDAE